MFDFNQPVLTDFNPFIKGGKKGSKRTRTKRNKRRNKSRTRRRYH